MVSDMDLCAYRFKHPIESGFFRVQSAEQIADLLHRSIEIIILVAQRSATILALGGNLRTGWHFCCSFLPQLHSVGLRLCWYG